MLRRLPIRLRLALAFAAAMALVLFATGAFVYLRLHDDLTHSVDQGLRARAVSVGPFVERAGRDEGLVQLLRRDGRVDRSAPGVPPRSFLSGSELARARSGSVLFERRSPLGGEQHWRVLALGVDTPAGPRIAVLAAPLQARGEALADLTVELLFGGAAALVLASLGAYALAGAALRPVDAMSRKAAAISLAGDHGRLPVPETRDEIAHLGERLNEMLARIEAALAHERRFLADASHELRTPLAVLKAELELALRRRRPPEELERVLASAVEETDRLARLADDLLLVARAQGGTVPLRPSPSPVAEILTGVAERFRPQARTAGRRIDIRAADGLDAQCDPVQIGQALANLVDNALRHGDGTVTLAAEAHDGAVELHVRDDGGGFPPGFLPHAFERFSRADEARSRGGTGLGLSIAEAIALAHGGSAGAANRPSGGSDVWLSLPRARTS
jgi:two-component system, OmpR family, sensor kinase